MLTCSVSSTRRFAIHRAAALRSLRRRAPRSPFCMRPCPGLVSGGLMVVVGGQQGRVMLTPSEQPTWRQRQQLDDSNQAIWWLTAGVVTVFGGVFAFVPLYKMYCQSTGQGQAVQSHKEYSPPPAVGSADAKRLVTVDFTGTVHTALPWEFVPQQRRVVVGLGETALAFYRAKNTSDKPIIGVSVYHMIPPETGLYFNKIQCFCFDEQLINPQEEVDLPIFFFIDPMMGRDSRFDHIDRITLSYLFFESDSELPEEYEEFRRGTPSGQNPQVLAAPAPASPKAV
mmetsp:Transcript_60405/g.140699  ORF Transcript_60405/g.140699 Transcript_60405/m.140699 type:complete len:284 (-) Transcript_60405:139-990(-)